eukprot:CAMPEP_0114588480 /NCGR_PEP_ID=MMETSP0125-20121206/11172_1 /TAXON_ID=485358 ORGANISM="Aristerostoma sp., Strain ATCC 50986" /NCGR_SAMPLE_ID=MMETSP0125 /ASSEMBLY_ACC=CAM_ASM_000245 /LENGTH=228 /DNA_ID=CAMNT_0001784897 /DNA_START=198 /DNA_END=884 /DNA_ORIENTATION=-
MSTSVDQVIYGNLSPEENMDKVAQLVHKVTENCIEEVDKLLDNPQPFIRELIKKAELRGVNLDEPAPALPEDFHQWIQDAEAFGAGFLSTFDINYNLPDYQYCIVATNNASNTAAEIQYYFNQNTIRSILKAFELIGPLYDYIGEALYACGQADHAAEQRVEQFIQDLQNLDFLRRLTISFLQQWPTLYKDGSAAAGACSAGKYVSCGAYTAQVVNDLAAVYNGIPSQ